MDQRRAAGALLALAVCIGSAAAAPTASNQTALDLYDSSTEGCYYNFQHYGEGDRIMTNEPCLNCTCHNRMLMCYLRVCPFTKPIGQDCTVEKRADQCCPIVTCPDVPVDLLTSTTNSPAEYGATGLGKLDKYGCSIHGKYFPEGSKVPPTPNKPCEHCYCIRNMTTCVMQECTLHVDGCTPIYHKDVCCPVRYSCDHPEDETLLLDDMTTTVRPTPGFLLTTTTLSPVTQMSQDCVHDDQIFSDGALIKTEKACEHCYCMKGDIVCVVQECGTPMENEGKNCTSQAPREGQCCPDTYICEGDEVTTEPPSEFTTKPQMKEDRTTPPPRRVGVEGSGYRNEDEPAYTEIPSFETDSEGSGYEQATEPAIDIITPEKETLEISAKPIDELLHIGTTTLKTPTLEEIERTTEPDKSLNTVPSDEEGYELSVNEKTTPSIEAMVTEPTITSHEQEQIEDKLTEAEKPSTPAVLSMLDEVSSTTDSPFRKEDDVGEPTETFDSIRDEATTKVADYQDKTTTVQGYATHDETEAPFMEELEKQTTLSAQYTQKDIDQTFESKLTTESIFETSSSSEPKPYTSIETTTDSLEPSMVATTATVADEIIYEPETTSAAENEIEDILTTLSPGRIPGEGDCLLNEITYRNNSEVPSSNVCHTSCRCISSIIKCDPIICSPPPEYMDNCQPTYDPPGSCCPTYVCHTGETMPPQPHSQMSGTESPEPSPAIECHGDECEIRKDQKTPTIDSSETPASDQCETAECGTHSQTPINELPIEKCDDGKCFPPTPQCADGDCQGTPVEEPVIVPVKDVPLCENEADCNRIKPESPSCEGEECEHVNLDCDGSDCSTAAIKPPVESSPVCKNEEDCKGIKPEAPSCNGEGCEHAVSGCSGSDCISDAAKLPAKSSPVCENGGDCKEIKPDTTLCHGEECTPVNVGCVGSDCSADSSKPSVVDGIDEPCTETPCRRKETDEVQGPGPSDCEGSECVQQVPTSADNDNVSATELLNPDARPIDVTTTKQEVQTELPESNLLENVTPEQPEQGSTSISSLKDEESGLTSEKPESAQDDKHKIEFTPLSDTSSESTYVPTTESMYPVREDHTFTKAQETAPTDQTRIGESDVPEETVTKAPEDVISSSVTEYQETTAKTIEEELVQDLSTAERQESSTKTIQLGETGTELPITTSQEGLLEKETKPSISQELDNDVTVSVENVPPETSATDTSIAPSIQESADLEHYATESPSIPPTVTESVAHESEVTKSDETLDTTAKTPKESDIPETEAATDSPKDDSRTTIEEEVIYQPAQTESPSYTQKEDKTSAADAATEKMTEDADRIPEAPEMYNTEIPEDFTEVLEPVTNAHDSVATDSPVIEEVTKSSTAAYPLHEVMEENLTEVPEIPEDASTEKETGLPSVTQKNDEGIATTQASISEGDVAQTEASEIPALGEKVPKTESSTEHQEISEIHKPGDHIPEYLSTVKEDQQTEVPVIKIIESDKTMTEKPDDLITIQTHPEDEDKTKPTQKPTETDEIVTGEQEISTEEPSFVSLEESPATEKIPSEPFLPVLTEATIDSMFVQPGATTESVEVVSETQTLSSEVEEVGTKKPDFISVDEKTEAPVDVHEVIIPEIMPEGPSTVISEYSTQYPEVHTGITEDKEPIKDEEPQKAGTEIPMEFITKAQAVTELPEVFSTEQPKYSDIPTETGPVKLPEDSTLGIEAQSQTTVETVTLGIRIKDEPTVDTEDQTEGPEKIFTVPVLQATTVPSILPAQEDFKRTTESQVTETGFAMETTMPESHVKETQPQGTESPKITASEPEDLGTDYPHIKPTAEEPVTVTQPETLPEIIQNIPTEANLEKTTKEEFKKEVTSAEMSTETSPDISIDEKSSEKPQTDVTLKEHDEITEMMQDLSTERTHISEEPMTTVTSVQEISHKTSTETAQDTVITESMYNPTEKPIDEQEMMTVVQNEPTNVPQETQKEPHDTFTETPQDTSSPQESGFVEPEKYTASGLEVTTPVAQEVVTGTPQKEVSEISDEIPTEAETTEAQEQDKDEQQPTQLATEEPDVPKQESSTQLPESPVLVPENEGTEQPYVQEQTTPDLVELEEHSHKPLEGTSTISPTEEVITESHDGERKPGASTEKDSYEEDITKLSTPSDEKSKVTVSDDVSDISTLPSTEKDEQSIPIGTSARPDQRFGEETSDEGIQTTQATGERGPSSDEDTPVKTGLIPSTERDTEPETTASGEYIPITSSESSDSAIPVETPQDKPEDGSTEEPYEDDKATEQSSDKPGQIMTAIPLDESTEKPEEIPAQETTEKSEKTPMKESTEKNDKDAEGTSSESPLETPVEKSSETPGVGPTEKPVMETIEEHTEELQEMSSESPLETPVTADEAIEKPVQEPLEVIQLEPMDKPTEEPIHKPEETPKEKPEEATVQELGEKTEDGLIEVPISTDQTKPEDNLEEKPAEVTSEKPDEKQNEKPLKEPVESTEDKPLAGPVQSPEDKPLEGPVQSPEDKPLEEPVQSPENKPLEGPVESPEDKPLEGPVESPEEKPLEGTSETPEDKPLEGPVESPEDKPLEGPVQSPEDKPLEEPVQSPEDKPLEGPVESPEEKPLEGPVKSPEDKPLEGSVGSPEDKPLEEPVDSPEDKPLEGPVESPEDKPLREPIVPPEEEVSVEQTTEKLAEEPAEKPAGEPSDILTEVNPEEKPIQESEEKPDEEPIKEPSGLPDDKPLKENDLKPDEKPTEEKTTDKPEVITEGIPTPGEKPDEKPFETPDETVATTAAPESPKPGFNEVQPTDEVPDDFPPSGGTSGYGTEPDYVEEDQAFGPGTCRYGGKVYVSAQQIPRDDPCDFCFCFRSDIICLQQSCPPPIHGCHEEPIQGFCCPRYECPVAMATSLNVTTTTTTTTTTLPPHFLPHAYKGAAQRRGCQIKGHTYKVGEVVRASSGPCLHCTCGGDGQMKCDPKACTPEPMLRQMIAAAVSAKRRR